MKNLTFIIAEAGVNHNGSIHIAKQLIDAAKVIGVDAIKFQSFKAEKLVSLHADKAEYQKRLTSINESQYKMIKRLELSEEDHKELIKYCKEKNVSFLSSAFDLESIDLLNDLGLEVFKIPSGEINNLPYLRKLGGLNKKIILSTGMSDMKDIKAALDVLTESGTEKGKICVLHCNTEYPTPYADVNLLAMITIKSSFNIRVGYSDHTTGIEIPIAAVALGAEIIEKHFTLDRSMDGPDHQASIEPGEFAEMVKAIRNIEIALGDGVKKPSPSELKNISIVRKSIVASQPIKIGEVFSKNNLSVKRPGTGLSPMLWDSVIGSVSRFEFNIDDLIAL